VRIESGLESAQFNAAQFPSVLFWKAMAPPVSRIDVIPAVVLARQASEFFEGIDHSGRSGPATPTMQQGMRPACLSRSISALQLIRENVKSIVVGFS